MFWISPKKTALDGRVPLSMRVRNVGGDLRSRPTLCVPLMKDAIASALPDLAPGSEGLAGTVSLQMKATTA
jgi:hypothetical protein